MTENDMTKNNKTKSEVIKKGLILEGGAMRGMFTAGVNDVLMEKGVVFDGAVGVSAGAAFGCNYKSGQIGRTIRYNTKFCNDKRYCGIGSWIKTGNIYNTDFCYGEVPLKYDKFDFKTYTENPMEFYVVCTDIESGKPVYHRYDGWEDHKFEWIRASASLPLVAEIVEIDGQKLLDGGMSDSIPVKFFEDIGYNRNIVVLTQPKDYQKKANKLMPIIRRKYKKYPKLVEVMENRHIMYNNELEYIKKKEDAGELFVIRPNEALNISRIEKNPEKLRAVYDEGRKVTEENFEKLISFLEYAG